MIAPAQALGLIFLIALVALSLMSACSSNTHGARPNTVCSPGKTYSQGQCR